MSQQTLTPYLVIYVDRLTTEGPDGEHFLAECPELGLEAWGRTAVGAEEKLGELIHERLVEVMQKPE